MPRILDAAARRPVVQLFLTLSLIAALALVLPSRASAGQLTVAAAATVAARPSTAPVFVLTDADVGHLAVKGPGSDPSGVHPRWRFADATPSGGERLTVAALSESRNAETTVAGRLENISAQALTGVRVEVLLVDGSGRPLAEGSAGLTRTKLAPGESTVFRASFPGGLGYEQIRIERSYVLPPAPGH